MSEEKKRIKLTAGGAKRVAELKRYKCPSCGKNFVIHPTRWALHVEECTKGLSQYLKILIYTDEKNKQTKEILGELILREGAGESPH